MGKRLKQVVEQYLVKHGTEGRRRLLGAVNKTERTLDNWLNYGVPKAHDAFALAVACGVNEAEALRLAKEESASKKGRRSA